MQGVLKVHPATTPCSQHVRLSTTTTTTKTTAKQDLIKSGNVAPKAVCSVYAVSTEYYSKQCAKMLHTAVKQASQMLKKLD